MFSSTYVNEDLGLWIPFTAKSERALAERAAEIDRKVTAALEDHLARKRVETTFDLGDPNANI